MSSPSRFIPDLEGRVGEIQLRPGNWVDAKQRNGKVFEKGNNDSGEPVNTLVEITA